MGFLLIVPLNYYRSEESMEPAGSLTTNIGIEKELICSTGVSIAGAKGKSP